MRITRPRATKLSQIAIDADLDMGAHSFKTDIVAESTEGAGVAVDGVENKDSELIANKYSTLWSVAIAAPFRLFSVAGEETAPTGVFFKPDGTKMYIIGTENDEVHEYDLSVAWDVTSAVWLQLFSVAAEEITPEGVFVKPDGTKMYIIGDQGDEINEYDLGTAWNISTAVALQLFSVVGEETAPRGLFFKPDGTKMYIVGTVGKDVNEYDLGTAWDVTSAVWLQLFSVAAEEDDPEDIFFKPDGLTMYIIGNSRDGVTEYDLGTAWDISTAVASRFSSVAGEETTPTGLFFRPSGTKMYIIGSEVGEVNEYNLYV